MATLRVWDRGIARRLAAVGAFPFPSGARERFRFEHETMNADGLRMVEDATRQWFRLAARHPRAALAMPSVVVDAMWREVARHTREYDAFCADAFGRPLHHVPASSVRAESVGPGLSAAYRLAREDESTEAPRLPLLFRVDRELAVAGGHRYIADCGGRASCHEVPGARCLRHITGPEKTKRNGWQIKEGRGLGGTYHDSGPGCGVGFDGGHGGGS